MSGFYFSATTRHLLIFFPIIMEMSGFDFSQQDISKYLITVQQQDISKQYCISVQQQDTSKFCFLFFRTKKLEFGNLSLATTYTY